MSFRRGQFPAGRFPTFVVIRAWIEWIAVGETVCLGLAVEGTSGADSPKC